MLPQGRGAAGGQRACRGVSRSSKECLGWRLPGANFGVTTDFLEGAEPWDLHVLVAFGCCPSTDTSTSSWGSPVIGSCDFLFLEVSLQYFGTMSVFGLSRSHFYLSLPFLSNSMEQGLLTQHSRKPNTKPSPSSLLYYLWFPPTASFIHSLNIFGNPGHNLGSMPCAGVPDAVPAIR